MYVGSAGVGIGVEWASDNDDDDDDYDELVVGPKKKRKEGQENVMFTLAEAFTAISSSSLRTCMLRWAEEGSPAKQDGVPRRGSIILIRWCWKQKSLKVLL
jgi:hypothetical protein